MHTITSPSELAELLFEELDKSEPRQEVDPSFLLRIGGICHGLIYGGLEGDPPYLSDMFAVHSEDRSATWCGTKLVGFAQSLAAEGCFDPARVWSTRRLIELMMAALNSNDLRVEQDQETGDFHIVSTERFSIEHDVTVWVELEPEPEITSPEKPGSS